MRNPLRTETHFATGRIVAIQEDRFRLETDIGQGLLLTLGKDSRQSPGDLAAWHAADARVIVLYSGKANLESGVACWVRRWK
jgi:hypothetical protein